MTYPEHIIHVSSDVHLGWCQVYVIEKVKVWLELLLFDLPGIVLEVVHHIWRLLR